MADTRPDFSSEALKASIERVLETAREHVVSISAPSPARCALEAVLLASAPYIQASRGEGAMSVHLPLLVHAAVTGSAERAEPLAAALLLLESGIYALDYFMDGEVDASLDAWPAEALVLAASSLISFAPHQLLLQLEVAPERLVAIQRQLADGLAQISLGQSLDIATKQQAAPSTADVERAVRGKTGQRRALYAALGAVLAGAAPQQVACYAEYGYCLGVARQLTSDMGDLFARKRSRDLDSGVRTLPLAHYLEHADEASRGTMLEMLELARTTGDPLPVRQRLRESGSLRATMLRREVFCQRALRVLDQVDPPFLARQQLRAFVQATSLAGR